MSTGTWQHGKRVRRVEIIAGNSNGVWKHVRRRFSEILAASCRSRGYLRCNGVRDLNGDSERRNPRRQC